jgi:hypothetical protein
MVDISISDKQMKPAVVHTDQFADGVLCFTLADYMQNDKDLRKFNAYVVTSINGTIDITQVPYTVSGRSLKITWSLSSYTLKDPGVIQYQIRFSQSEADGTAVWYSYKGVLINRLSINADDYVSANYPTLLKQNQDLIHTLSGAFGAEIVYMPVGEPIPVEERLTGRLYYQWLDTPTTAASCATGTVNLGERPLADSGLYINGAHIFVDNTSEEAYVLGASAWIDAIAAANCGVTASDISEGKDTILLISAKNAGEAGNNIGLELGLALYGAGANTTNPSGGHVSGSTLTGGSDAQTGVEYPRGQFEDANGNVIGKNTAKTYVDASSPWGIPDYSAGVEVANSGFTAQYDGLLVFTGKHSWLNKTVRKVVLDGVNEVVFAVESTDAYNEAAQGCLPIKKGTSVTFENMDQFTGTFYPLMKG